MWKSRVSSAKATELPCDRPQQLERGRQQIMNDLDSAIRAYGVPYRLDGWTCEETRRLTGGSAGKLDVYYWSPPSDSGQRKKFRSIKEVLNHLGILQAAANKKIALLQKTELEFLEEQVSAARTRYENKWCALLSQRVVTLRNMPWPVAPPPTERSPPTMTLETVREFLLLGGDAALSDARVLLQSELKRWHPDKFCVQWGTKLDANERCAILEGVKEVTRILVALKKETDAAAERAS